MHPITVAATGVYTLALIFLLQVFSIVPYLAENLSGRAGVGYSLQERFFLLAGITLWFSAPLIAQWMIGKSEDRRIEWKDGVLQNTLRFLLTLFGMIVLVHAIPQFLGALTVTIQRIPYGEQNAVGAMYHSASNVENIPATLFEILAGAICIAAPNSVARATLHLQTPTPIIADPSHRAH